MSGPFNTTTPLPDRPSLTLVNGRTFTVAAADGTLDGGVTGTVFEDIRMLSTFEMVVLDGQQPIPQQHLATSQPTAFQAVTVSRPHERADTEGEPMEMLIRRQHIGRGVRHDVEIHNFDAAAITRTLRLLIGTDFAHLFDMKAGRPGPVEANLTARADGSFALVDPDDRNDSEVRINCSRDPDSVDEAGGGLEWSVEVAGRSTTALSITFQPAWDGVAADMLFPLREDGARPLVLQSRMTDQPGSHGIETTDSRLSTAFDRSLRDLASLRIFDPSNPDRTVVAAGAPWFMTLFGRDSLLTSWMALPFAPELADGVLRALGALQGSRINGDTEEAPGKILHELRRRGGDAAFEDRGRYYGTVDATPLFVMLAAEAHRWGHIDRAALADLTPYVDAAVRWIVSELDHGPAGWLTYERSTDVGLANQGWKDSWDGVTFADGRLPTGPIALAEVQGYTYAALVAAADLVEKAGMATQLDPHRLRQLADDLKTRFNEQFWVPATFSFAQGLTADGTQIDSVTTNPGHAIWCGITDDGMANRYLDRVMDDDLWSGWGLRTLSPDAAAFNPLSYHNGSVWPHDSALVTAGAARLGRMDVVRTLVNGALDTAERFEGRPPELFSGIGRDVADSPVPYPGSCSPQAWSAASILLHVRSFMLLEPEEMAATGDSDEMTLTQSVIPSTVTLSGVRIGNRAVTVTGSTTR